MREVQPEQPLGITSLAPATAAGKATWCTAALAGPLASARETGSRPRLRLGGWTAGSGLARKLEGRSLKADVSANRRTITFPTSGASREEVAAAGAAVAAGSLRPHVAAWWAKEAPPRATAIQFEAQPGELQLSEVQAGDVQLLDGVEAAAARQSLAALLGERDCCGGGACGLHRRGGGWLASSSALASAARRLNLVKASMRHPSSCRAAGGPPGGTAGRS